MTDYTLNTEGGIATVSFDLPGKLNVMGEAFVNSMAEVSTLLENQREDLSGVILTSSKPTFIAGGDLKILSSAVPENAGDLFTFFEHMKGELRRLERLCLPVVAALNGTALGGGMELALACHHRIAVDNEAARFGFPEIDYALLPGAGGVVRLTRLIGLEAALDYLLSGKRVAPATAMADGLIDEIVPDRPAMFAAARKWIAENADATQPWDEIGHIGSYALPPGPRSSLAAAQLAGSPASAATYEMRRIADVAAQATFLDFDAALRVETRVLIELMLRPEVAERISAFFSASREKAV